MRPTFMGFETAKSSIFANQKSLDIMGNNLANADTNGYTRQRVERASVSPSSYTTRVASSRIALAGQGVSTVGVSQLRDNFLDKRFRDEYSNSSYHGQAASILSEIQSALGDGHDITSESGLYSAVQQLYTSLNDFVQDPTMDTEANIVMSAFKNITQVLQQLDSNLVNVANQQINDLGVSVSRVNEIAVQIANLNKSIGEDATVLTSDNESFRANELLDQRNLLLDELASYGGINVTQLANGKVNVEFGGHMMIEENRYNTLHLSTNSDNTASVRWQSTGEAFSSASGSLTASLHYINGRGNNMQNKTETPYQGIPYYRDQLNTFAKSLAEVANNTVPVYDKTTGKPQVDADGNIVYKTLLGNKNDDSANPNVALTAGNISVSKEWTQNGAGYFIYNRDEEVEDYAQQIANLLTESSYTFTSYGEKFTGSFVDFEITMLGKLASDLSFQNGRQEATATVANDFLDRRDEISGVSRDEETADMMKFQKAYEAAARFMTTLDDLLEIVINRMGRTGL
ncbi:flagellar hook-associated protein FlgK [Scatolibacter rhodanostii]|uniref:flagellar hook-associated protein FlgK n=1 Tax=Scatolibacter rhodanostii TaxID=2014781 RepID=UPI000C070EB4|nr:flagellar hook-associated protein FlgK [Scatolibacter rhodanostii]